MDEARNDADDIIKVVHENIALFDEIMRLRDLICDIASELTDPMERYEYKVPLTSDTRNRLNDVLNGNLITRPRERGAEGGDGAADEERQEGKEGDAKTVRQKEGTEGVLRIGE